MPDRPMMMARVGKSGPLMCSIRSGRVASGLSSTQMAALMTSRMLWGGMLVAMPTAMPLEPFTSRLGNREGRVLGSRRVLEGISDIRDETDRNGMRIVIELKRDANPQVVLNRLFAQTQLQTTFAINMLALVEVNSISRSLPLS